MARPRKNTVDYFPHYVSHGKTIFTLETMYGNDGYACWFKLLEVLGGTPEHAFDIKDKANWVYLVARFKVNEEITNQILNTLCDLEAIDRKLFEQGLIWCDNLLSELEAVYRKRSTETPVKPSFLPENPNEHDESSEKTPQSRVEKSRVEKKKILSEETSDVPPSSSDLPLPETEEVKVASYMADTILERDPNYKFLINGKRNKTVSQWAEEIEKLNRLDMREWNQIWEVTRWCLNDRFWSTNILSGKKLRDQFGRLFLQMSDQSGESSFPDSGSSSSMYEKVVQ